MRQQKVLFLTFCLLCFTTMVWAQQAITGTVSDTIGAKLPGVSITVVGKSVGTITDDNGKFSISVPVGSTQLSFSLVGYKAQTVTLGTRTDFIITMSAVPNSLQDVVVVGYGVQRKRDVTGTISSVKGDDLRNQPVSNAASALQGRASGVDIVRSDGAPGSGPQIRIRGTGTINSSDPLVVIDGVPAGSLSDISPNDIASIEILKDASSSAIYGTRAANGVVLVTTKKGNFGEGIKTSINAYSGQSKVLNYIDLLQAPDLLTLKREGYTNDGEAIPALWMNDSLGVQKTDWQRALFGTGKTNNADVAVRGGSANSSFSFSGNYYDEKGIITNTYFKRLSTRINSEHRLLKIFKVGENFLYSVTKGNGFDTRSGQSGLVWSALRYNPSKVVKNPDGTWGNTEGTGDINNPVFTAASPDVNNHNNNVLANGYVEVNPSKGLSLRANLGYSSTVYSNFYFQPADPNQGRQIAQAILTQNESEAYSRLSEYTFTYNNVFAKNHTVNLTGGYSAQIFYGNGFFAARKGYLDVTEPFRNLDNGNIENDDDGGRRNVKSGLASYFGRLNYGYKGKYLLTATLRADGSSKFPKGNRWGYFPAFSAGWRISDEAFFKENVPFVSDLKLTGGWGQLGNQAIPDLQYLSIINPGYNYNFGTNQVGGTAITTLSNPQVTWERAEMTNISLEFALLKNRLTGTVTYFNKDTKDMLINIALVPTYGTALLPNQNIGTLNNRGYEVELNWRNSVGSDFTYSIGANASFIKNKVTYLFGNKNSFIGATLNNRENLETSRTYEGQPLGSFYGLRTNGIYQNQKEIDDDPNVANDDKATIHPGDVKFIDQNGDGKIDEQDRVNIGNPNPKMVYGINGSAAYKGFDINFSFAGVAGVDLYNADHETGLNSTKIFNYYADQLNRWHGEGTSNRVPRVSASDPNNNYTSSDLWIENGSYLALKNVSLGYSFSNLHIKDATLTNIRVYVSCYNAFYITKYSGYTPELGYVSTDPQVANRQRGVDVAQYPSSRTFTVGASLNF